ncbi:tyrosine-type recombinase/integrase [Aeoliella sp.]|uniref:tyrosine-type recombinase/integrase n=1 Tax=Aeoliella sp. TaxID=2795800 RepID=UPI003CCB8BAD
MAGITKLKNGRRLQFMLAGERKQIWLGKMNVDDADRVLRRVEDLIAAAVEGRAPRPATSEWLAEQGDKLKKKLAAHGLCEIAERLRVPTVGDLVNGYRQKKFGGYEQRTRANHELVFTNLLTFWKLGTPLDSITEGDADDYRDWLMNERKPRLNETSARKDCAVVSKLMRYAMRKKWIVANPFIDVPTSNMAGGKLTMISRADSMAILGKLKGTEWPLMFALARWGGLRVPSDVQGLRWSGIDWKQRRFTFYAKKTKSWRTVPIFAELMPLFEQRHQAAETGEGEELVVPKCETLKGAALRKPLLMAIKRAGLEQWPDLWKNLRQVREIELAREHPLHVVTTWIGNSEAVALKHYLKVTDEDFERALS